MKKIEQKNIVKALLIHLTLEFSDVAHLYDTIFNSDLLRHKSHGEISTFLYNLGSKISCERQVYAMLSQFQQIRA
jgi:hypothetical protein